MRNILVALAVCFFWASSDIVWSKDAAPSPAKKAAKPAGSATIVLTAEQQEFRVLMRHKLDRVKADVKILKAKSKREAKNATEQSKKAATEAVDEVDRQVQDAEKKLKELGRSTEDAWSELKTGMEKSVEDLEKSVQKAKEELKS